MSLLVGIDEAGRGALAGPLYVCALLGGEQDLLFARDSKTLSRESRGRMARQILTGAQSVGVGWVSASTIDRLGLSKSLTLATRRAFSRISYENQPIVIDGPFDFLKLEGKNVKTVIGADLSIKQVSAASIIAKTRRDQHMFRQARLYPGWDFDKHVGYGTKEHLAKINEREPTKLHRKSFRPINEYTKGQLRRK